MLFFISLQRNSVNDTNVKTTVMANGTSQIQETTLRLTTKMQRELGRVLEQTDEKMGEEVEAMMAENYALVEKDKDNNDINTTTEDGRRAETSEEIERKNYADDDERPTTLYNGNNRSFDDIYYTPEVVHEVTLAEYLLEQLGERTLSEHDRQIAEQIVGNLDSNGYLMRSIHAIADDLTFNEDVPTESDQVESVLDMVRQLDPPGIAAYDLKECLLLQLERKSGPYAQLAYRIVDECLDELSRKNFDRIASKLKEPVQRVKEAFEKEIRKLNPKPGSSYSSGKSDVHGLQIIPDFIVEVEDNKLRVSLSNRIPELCIEESIERAVEGFKKQKAVTPSMKKEQQVVRDKYADAKSFINLLKMRQETLFKIVKSLVLMQQDYFFTGDESQLHPMTLQNISDDTGINVSMVSRATSNRYIDTPWGVKPLRFFFSEGVMKRSDGEERMVTTREVKQELEHLIEGEDKKNPYSDDKLQKMLEAKGYDIKRRTITKYRDALGIPAASQRKI